MLPWRDAWATALYGPGGFYRRPEGPAGHFRTASHAAPGQLAEAIARLAAEVGARSVVDVGTGRAELPSALASADPDLDLWAVDVVPRPPGLPPAIRWAQELGELPDEAFDGALLVAWELLDVVPLTVLEIDGNGCASTVLVDSRTGRETLGGPPAAAEQNWVDRWWPAGDLEEGDRIEVGLSRDTFWENLTGRAFGNGAVAALGVDYAHTRSSRPAEGSLSGFRAGRPVPPKPDGTMDVTAHVAIDSVAAAGDRRAAQTELTELTDQATALARLGVTDGELLDPGSLGGFAWLLQTPLPTLL